MDYKKNKFLAAIRSGDTNNVRRLISQGRASVNDTQLCEGKDYTPLMVASMQGRHEVARLLLQKGAKVRHMLDSY